MHNLLTERAWDGRGRWCGDGPAPSYPRPRTDVKHQCAEPPRRHSECGIFTCLWCRRVVPWCFGCSGHDEVSDLLCDDCAVERGDHEVDHA